MPCSVSVFPPLSLILQMIVYCKRSEDYCCMYILFVYSPCTCCLLQRSPFSRSTHTQRSTKPTFPRVFIIEYLHEKLLLKQSTKKVFLRIIPSLQYRAAYCCRRLGWIKSCPWEFLRLCDVITDCFPFLFSPSGYVC